MTSSRNMNEILNNSILENILHFNSLPNQCVKYNGKEKKRDKRTPASKMRLKIFQQQKKNEIKLNFEFSKKKKSD